MTTNTPGQWIAYTGSEAQIEELKDTKYGYVLKRANGKEVHF